MNTNLSFAERERAILESIAGGRALRESLTAIVELIERQSSGMFCSILLLNDDRRTVRTGAAPSLPEAWVRALDGLAIGPAAGSCGTAAYLRERVVVDDIATHPYWEAYKSVALAHGLRACWSSPIFSAEREVLGTFAMYYREIRKPSAEELTWVDSATHLASIAIARDRADARVRRSEALLSLVYDNVEDVIFYLGVEGDGRYRVLSVNPAFEKITGIPGDSVLGRLVHEVMPAESLDVIFGNYRTAIRTGEKVTWEYEATYPTGVKIGEVTLCPVRDTSGVCTNVVCTVHDITARKNAEREREELHAKVAHAERMQALGTLAGGIVHDFNNVLAVITSYAEIIAREIEDAHPLKDDVDELRKATVRAVSMTRQLLAFSRHQRLEPKVLDINQAVANMKRMFERLLGAAMRLTIATPPGVASIRVDPTQLEQILMNLVVNARDAMPTGGTVSIETANVVLDADYVRHLPEAAPGAYVMLAVSDTGMGMDRATQTRIFEPFFTTKEKGKGTGLGLATVFGIVKQSGGHIAVHSEPGQGARFEIYLPAIDAGAVEKAARAGA